MMSVFHGNFRVYAATSKSVLQRGVSLVELAVLSIVLLVLLVAATDFSLSILARQQVHSAARAGMEYAIIKGFSQSELGASAPPGIKEAVMAAAGSTLGLRVASILPGDVSVSVKCSCYNGTPKENPVTTTSPPYCPATPLCQPPAAGPGEVPGVESPMAPYATVSVTGYYSPIFRFYWPNLLNNRVPIKATYIGRVAFRA